MPPALPIKETKMEKIKITDGWKQKTTRINKKLIINTGTVVVEGARHYGLPPDAKERRM